MGNLADWQSSFHTEAQRIFQDFASLSASGEWDNWATQSSLADDIRLLYFTLPGQLREIVDEVVERDFEGEPNPGELLVEMCRVHLATEKVCGRKQQ